jgi:(p)ppGpp synthase/HD superfamily hydrolase
MWGENSREILYRAHIKVIAEDKPGSLADLASIFAENNINISNALTKDLDARLSEFSFEGDFANVEDLRSLMKKVRTQKFVTSCIRILNDTRSKNEKTHHQH